MFQPADLSNLPEFGVGHAQDAEAATGCTAFVAPEGAACAVDVRGGGPATRETDLLRPENMIQDVHAVVLSGGSAFGLESACGVMEALASRGIGFKLGDACVPIVPAACLFDLLVGKNTWPDKAMGAAACEEALSNRGVAYLACGNVGAGTGATVGKMGLPTQAMKSGFGWAGLALGDIVVVACVAVNACGNIASEDGTWIAGTFDGNEVIDPYAAAMAAQAQMQATAEAEAGSRNAPVSNTTLGVVLTNADLSKAQATKVAQIAQDGYARAIRPVHTLNDGDTVFVMASRKVEADPNIVGIMAAEAMEQAIRKAVLSAGSAYGLPAAKDVL